MSDLTSRRQEAVFFKNRDFAVGQVIKWTYPDSDGFLDSGTGVIHFIAPPFTSFEEYPLEDEHFEKLFVMRNDGYRVKRKDPRVDGCWEIWPLDEDEVDGVVIIGVTRGLRREK